MRKPRKGHFYGGLSSCHCNVLNETRVESMNMCIRLHSLAASVLKTVHEGFRREALEHCYIHFSLAWSFRLHLNQAVAAIAKNGR